MAILHILINFLEANVNIRTFLVFLIVFFTFSWMVHGYINRVKNLPPGPRSWPFIGCLPQLIYMNRTYNNNIYRMFQVLADQYGPVCRLSLPFNTNVIIVSGHKAVFETLMRPGVGEDRPAFPQNQSDDRANGLGVILSTGEPWREHRRFSLTVLRGLGVGKKSFEDQIATESAYMTKEIETEQGRPFEPTVLFCNAVSNVICSVVVGKRFEYDDPEFKQLLHLMDGIVDQNSVASLLYILIPKLVPYLVNIPFFPKGAAVISFLNLRGRFRDMVNEHRATLDKEDTRDYIDVYLGEAQKKKEKGVQTYLNDTELRAAVQDFFIAGTETTATTLRWALLYMLKYPDVQKRVQEEIDSVVGRDRLPKSSDKLNLPYTQAVIQEIQRASSIVFLLPLRFAKQDTDILEFTIPKGSYVETNLHLASRDAAVWEEPDAFKPERFLDDEGEFVNFSHSLVFGAGKRSCLGEQLARLELFIFFTHLMHRFSFKKAPEGDSLNLQPKPGAVLTPYPYNICAVGR